MRRSSRRWPTAAIVLTVGVIIGAAGCGGDSDGPAVRTLTIRDFAFSPTTLRVPKGSVIKVVNEDDAPHTATADDGSFDTSELNQGESKEIELPTAGEVAFHCAIHDYMRGVIRIGS